MTDQVRVVIAEDHPMFREGLAATLTSGNCVVVAEVASGREALAAVLEQRPDVLVLDLEMPDGNGLEVLSALRAASESAPRVLVLTSHDDDANVYSAMRAGAAGYLIKSASPDEIRQSVALVASGGAAFDGSAWERINRHFATAGRASRDSPFPELTPREREVLALMADGFSNERIADHYVVSLKTVRNQVSSILMKLGLSSRSEAIVQARRRGMGSG
jgi:DNA-binding NarL/FixJ family response regulator